MTKLFLQHRRKLYAQFFATLFLVITAFTCAIALAGAYLTWLAARDEKLFALYDQQHDSKLAKHCGNKGALVRDAAKNSTLCMHVNKDGEVLFVEVPSAPLLASRGTK